jgi:hypothetical protein
MKQKTLFHFISASIVLFFTVILLYGAEAWLASEEWEIELGTKLRIERVAEKYGAKWDKRDKYENGIRDGSKKQHTVNTGFLAQDLKKLQDDNNLHYLDLVYESNPDKLEAKYGNLIPVLVKAIQDLSLEVKELKSKLA